MQWFYLISLLVSIGGLALVDQHWKLAFWRNAKVTTTTLLTTIAVFILWDFLGIFLGVFFHGNGAYALPFRLAPEFPIEEILFLFLLAYSTLIVYHGVQLWRSRI